MVKGAEFSSFSSFTVPGIVSSVFFSRLCLFVCLFLLRSDVYMKVLGLIKKREKFMLCYFADI